MSKKTSDSTVIGKLHDPNFIMPDTKASLQEKPVDFRSDDPTVIGRLHDPDFMMPGQQEKLDAEKIKKATLQTELDQAAEDKLFPIKTSEKDAKTRIGLIDQEKLKVENELAEVRNKIKRNNTIGKILGTHPDAKYKKELEHELEVLTEGRNRLFAQDADVADIDRELGLIMRELEQVTEERQEAEGARPYGTSFGGAASIDRGNPKEIAELRKSEADLQSRQGALEGKRKQLEYAATPLNAKETQEIENNMGQYSGNIKNQDILTKYGQDKVNRSLRTTTNFVYDDIASQHVEQQVKREDYDNMLTGEYAMYVAKGGSKAPMVSPEMRTKTDSIFTQVLKTNEYQEANLMGKRRLLGKAIKEESLKDIPTGEDVDADAAKKKALADQLEMTTYMSQRMMYNDKGDQLSLNGLQMMSEYINGDLVDRRIELENQQKAVKAGGGSSTTGKRDALNEQYGEENVQLYLDQLDKELKTVNDALLFNKQILDMNPQESKFRQFQSGLTSTPTKDLLSAGITEMVRMLNIADIAERATTGEVGWTDSKILETYTMMNMANGSSEMNQGLIPPYGAGKNISVMLPYMESFLMTNPVYLLGKAGTKFAVKGAAKTVKAKLRREIIGDTRLLLDPKVAKVYGQKYFSPIEFAGRMLERSGGIAAQTMASQPMLQTAIAKETMPNVQMTFEPQYNDMYARIEAKSAEEIKEGKRKAYVNTVAELYTEHMGTHIMKSFKGTGASMSNMELFKRYNLSKYLEVKQAANPKGRMTSFLNQKLGWHGIGEEYYEELANYFGSNIANNEAPIQDNFFKEQLQTLTTVAIFGGAMKGANLTEDWEVLRHGDQVRYRVTDAKGKKENIRIPTRMNDELKTIYDAGGDYTQPIYDWLYKNKKELKPKQVKLILQMTGQKMVDQGVDQIIKDSSPFPDLANAEDILAGKKQPSSEFPDLATAGDDLAKDKPKQSLADEIIAKSGVEDIAAEDEAAPGTLAFEGTAESDLSEREFKTDEEKYNQPPQDITPDRFNDWVADESNNPSEIHLAWKEESANTAAEQSEGNPLEDYILGQKITEETWNEFADKSHQSAEIKTGWFRGKGRKLDDLRDEAASMKGISEDVTIQDIINVMLKHPKGKVRVTSDIQKRLAARYKQVTGKTINSHRVLNQKKAETIPAGEELFSEEVTEGTSNPEGEMEISATEEAAIEKHNEQITKEHPELAEAGLLTTMPGGQYEVPTYEELLDRAEQMTEELQEITTQDEQGNMRISSEYAQSMLKQFQVLNEEIGKRSKSEGIPFKYLMPSEQHHKLSTELRQGQEITGNVTSKGNKILTFHAQDGRQVKIIIPPSKKQSKKDKEAEENDIYLKTKKEIDILYNKYKSEFPEENDDSFRQKARVAEKYFDQLSEEAQLFIEEKLEGINFEDPDQSHYKGSRNSDANVVHGSQMVTLSEYFDNYNQETSIDKAKTEADKATLNQTSITLKRKKGKVWAVSNGVDIGFVEEFNQEYETQMLAKAEEYNTWIDDEITLAKQLFRRGQGNIYSGIPFSADHAEALKHIVKAIKYLIQKGFTNAEMIAKKIKERIRTSDKIGPKQKAYWSDIVNENMNLIEALLKEEAAAETAEFADEQLEIDWDNPEAAFLSGAQKKNVHLKTFNNIWKPVAEASNTSVSDVERQFYFMAHDPAAAEISNDATYQAFLQQYQSEDPMMKAMLSLLSKRPFSEIVSAFDFYSNVQIIKQTGILIQEDGSVSIKTLNPSENYGDFISNFHTAVKNYSFTHPTNKNTYTGYKGVQWEINWHAARAKELQQTIEHMPLEKRIAARKEQHQKDLDLLAKITGLTPEQWSKFFEDKKGIVRTAQLVRQDLNRTEFDTYEELLEADTYIKDFWRVQSDIVASLQRMAPKASLDTFKEKLNAFFLKGKGDSLSNLYQLLTANEDRDELGMSGMDIKTDRFNSMQQNSHLFHMAEMIGREVTILNGLHNLALNKEKKGTHSAKMSVADIWTSLAALYAEGKDTYQQYMGQFGDKSTLYLIETQKLKPTAEDYKKIKEVFPEFEQAVGEFLKDIVHPQGALFAHTTDKGIRGLASETEGEFMENKRVNFAREFIYNYAMAMPEINAIFHGNLDQYENKKKGVTALGGMFKRGGSTSSPGYLLNSMIEGGVGKTYRVLVVNDDSLMQLMSDGKRKTFREPDGLSIGLGEFFEKVAVSMGSIYANLNNPDRKEKFLTSFKALHSNVKDGRRGLMKTNNINIESLRMKHKDLYKDMREYMQKHGIDMITFTSGNKFTEEENYEPMQMFSEDGKFIAKTPAKGQVFERNTSDLYVQQDLRHSTKAKSRPMVSQQRANMLSLPNSNVISELMLAIQTSSMNDLEAKITKEGVDNVRLEWINEVVSEFSHPDIYRMLNAGVGINEPSMRNMLRTILSSQVKKYALDIPINGITTQEIPDIFGILDEREEYLDKDGVLRVSLPDIATNVDGARAQWAGPDGSFINHPELAIAYIMDRKAQYWDLFDRDGKLMEWEIHKKNGAIPGEPVISTRVPASDLHSHTVARLRFNMPYGNLTMLDNKSRVASGSDFDGDSRFNQVLFKNQQGNAVTGNTTEGISNQIMMEMVHGYSDPTMTGIINAETNPDAYDPIVAKRRADANEPKWNERDWRPYAKAWERNKVGVDLKGALTDMSTLFSIASKYQIQLQTKIVNGKTVPVVYNPVTKEYLTAFIADTYGQMKRHIDNLLNMAYDNAKDPKIEDMGLNEITVNMFMVALMTDPKLNSGNFKTAEAHYKAIYDAIEKQTVYFTTPMMLDFTRLMRGQNGGLELKDSKEVWKVMKQLHKGAEKELKTFFNLAQELPEIRRFYGLVQKAPKNSVELQMAYQLLNKIQKNKFKLFNSKNFFTNNTLELRREFAIIPKTLDFVQNRIFFDAIESTETGRDIVEFLISKIQQYYTQSEEKGKDYVFEEFNKEQYDSIAYMMNNILSVLTVNPNKSFYEVRREALQAYKENELSGNLFIQYLQILPKKDGLSLEIDPEFKRAAIKDVELKEIHTAWDELNEGVREKLIAYVFHRFGTASSRMRGSFYSLISDKEKVYIAERNQEEIDDWTDGMLSPEQQYKIAKLIIHATKDAEIRNLWGEGKYDARNLNVNVADPSTDTHLDYDALESTEGAIDKESKDDWIEEYGLPDMSKAEFAEMLSKALKVDKNDNLDFNRHIIPWAQKIIAARDADINYFKNQDEQISDEELKSMVAEDIIGEALASDDPAIQEFILARMQAMYPEVEFFKSKDKFFDFLRKNGARLHNISPSAVGHALGNAIYADPTQAVQSTILHEYAHVYWDALPEDHYTKRQLLRHFRTLPGNENLPERLIEEQIIIAIGRSAFNMAEAGYNDSFSNKFADLLKNFWAAVKRLLGKVNQQELVDEMAQSLWTNKDSINPQTITGQRVMKNMAESNMSSHLSGNGKYYVVGGKPFARVSMVSDFVKQSTFNEEAYIEEQIQKAINKYYREHGQAMPTLEQIEVGHQVAAKMEANRRSTNLVKAITAEVFGGEEVSQEQVKASFETMESYHVLRKSLLQFRTALLKKYPDAEFDTGHITYSKVHQIAGTVDIRLKLGNGKYVIIKVQATKYPYMVGPQTFHDYYTQSWGSLKAPFKEGTADDKKTENSIQAKLYAAMEESAGREVQEIFILPIIKTPTEDGRIQDAWVANRIEGKPLQNMVAVPWRDSKGDRIKADFDMLIKIAQAYADNKKKNQAKPISNKEEMIKAGTLPEVAQAQMNAEAFLAESTASSFEDMSYKDIENLLGYGLEKMIAKLHSLGYTTEDIRGVDHIEMKYLFFLAHENVKKDQWVENKKNYIQNVKVGTKFTAVANEKNTGETKYHLEVGDRQLYMEEAGHGTLEKGDEIVQIVKNTDDTGQDYFKAYYFTVESTNTKYGTIRAIDQNTGDVINMQSINPAYGTMKLIDEDASISKDSYQPKYTKVLEDKTEEQYKRLDQEVAKLGDQAYAEYENRMVFIDRFLNKHNTVEKLREAIGNQQKLIVLHQGLRSSDEPQINHFNTFMEEVLTSHYLAEQIRYEAKNMKMNQVKPAILSIYFFFNADENSTKTMFRFDNPQLIKLFAPDRVIGGKHVPLHFIRRGVVEAYQEAAFSQIGIRDALKPFLGKIDHDNVVESIQGAPYYKNPNTPGLSKEEKEFLSIVYKYHYKYNSSYKHLKRKGKSYPRQVKTSLMFATTGELVEKYGRRHGKVMRELLMPNSYDDIEIDEIFINELGNYEKTGEKTTLGKQKEAFVYIHGNDNHNKQWLSSQWRHYTSKLLGMGSPGILKHYQRLARKEYETIKKSDPVILRKKGIMPTAGRGNPKYQSSYFSEAEAKTIEGLIFEHHMGPVLAPMDHMMAQIEGTTNVSEWIKDYTDKIIFRRPSDNIPEGWRRFINWFIRLNSLAKMAFQLRVQVKNLGIGLGMNVTRETMAYYIGVKKTAKSLFDPKAEEGIWKVVNIMKKTNLIMHMADDPKFDQLEKMMIKRSLLTGKARAKVPLWAQLANAGYKPMTFFENVIQIPLLMGMITEEEFSAYDAKGNVIDEGKKINRARMHELREALRSVHGDYGPLNAAQIWQTTIGEAAAQFRKWGTAMIDKEFATYQMDSNYKVRSGILTTVKMFLYDRVVWNNKSDQEREIEFKKIVKDAEGKSQFDKVFFKGTTEYLERLIAAHGEGKVTIKELSMEDRRKLLSAVSQLATGVWMLINKLFLGGDDDEFKNLTDKEKAKLDKKGVQRYRKYIRRKKLLGDFWNKYMNRYGSDLYFMFATDQWQYVIDNPIPFTGIVTNIIAFSTQLTGWLYGFIPGSEIRLFGDDKAFKIHSNIAVYEKDSRYSRKGWPKWMTSGLSALPGGSQVRSMMENTFYVLDNRQIYDIEKIFSEAGLDQAFIDETIARMGKPTMSEFDIRLWSSWWDTFNRDLKTGGKALAIAQKLEEEGYPANKYRINEIIRTIDYLDTTSRQRKDLIKAIQGLSFVEQFINGNFTDEEKAQWEAAMKAAKDVETKKQIKTKKGAKREAEDIIPILQEFNN